MQIELKPCPFCGDTPKEIVDATKILCVHRMIHRCAVIPPFSLEAATPEEVAAQWNRRALTSATPHDVAGLVEAYATDYDYRADNGGGYTPTDGERAMLVDFGHGLLSKAATALRLSAGGGWMAIESAPRDGTRFLALQGSRHFDCWWHDAGYGEAYWQDECDSEPNPDRWQPLPAPPAEGK